MGTISQLHDRTRPVAHLIESEEEAIEIARALAVELGRHAGERDINRVMPASEVDAVSRSGLLGLTIPAEYGGLDISNIILAEIVALIAEGDASVADVVQTHFRVLEAVRAGAIEDQREFLFARAMAGDRFGLAGGTKPGETVGAFTLAADGPGHRITGRGADAGAVLFADWIAVHADDPAGRPMLAVLSRHCEGIQTIDDWDSFGLRTRGSGTLVLHNASADGKGLIAHYKTLERPTTIIAVGELLRAALALGIARAALSATTTMIRQDRARKTSGLQDAILHHLGKLAIGIETAAATIERAGKRVDIAQVSPLAETVRDAEISTGVAAAVSSQAALDTANALFELAGAEATKVGINLDRHWRDARAHAATCDPGSRLLAIGSHHLHASSETA